MLEYFDSENKTETAESENEIDLITSLEENSGDPKQDDNKPFSERSQCIFSSNSEESKTLKSALADLLGNAEPGSAAETWLKSNSSEQRANIRNDLVEKACGNTSETDDAIKQLRLISGLEAICELHSPSSSRPDHRDRARIQALNTLAELEKVDPANYASVLSSLFIDGTPAMSDAVLKAQGLAAIESDLIAEKAESLLMAFAQNSDKSALDKLAAYNRLLLSKGSTDLVEAQRWALELKVPAGETSGNRAEYGMLEEFAGKILSSEDKQKGILSMQFAGAELTAFFGRKQHSYTDGTQCFSLKKALPELQKLLIENGAGNLSNFRAFPISADSGQQLHILDKSSNVLAVLNEDGSFEKLTQAKDLDMGLELKYKYDHKGILEITDNRSGSFKRLSENLWQADFGEGAKLFKGELNLNSDGAYKFEGENLAGQKVTIEQKPDGSLLQIEANRAFELFRAADGSRVKQSFNPALPDGAKELTQFDQTGKKLLSLNLELKGTDWKAESGQNLPGKLCFDKDGQSAIIEERTALRVQLSDSSRHSAELKLDKLKVTRSLDGEVRSFSRVSEDADSELRYQRIGDSKCWSCCDGSIRFGELLADEFAELYPDEQGLEASRRSISDLLNSAGCDAASLAEFSCNMEKFEQRMLEMQTDPGSILETYKQTMKLIVGSNTAEGLSAAERLIIAQQIFKQLACPDTIDQGRHLTCNVTVLENLLYTNQPEVVTKIMTDLALEGKFLTAVSGKEIKLSSSQLRPDEEAKVKSTVDGQRSWASQIFQLAAINSHYQGRLNPKELPLVKMRTAEGNDLDLPNEYSVRFRSHLVLEDYFEILSPGGEVLGKGVGKETFEGRGLVEQSPNLRVEELRKIYSEIGGENGRVIFLSSSQASSDDHAVKRIDSAESLEEILSGRAKNAPLPLKLPVVVTVDGIKLQGKSVAGQHGAHVITVSEFYPADPERKLEARVKVNNSWGLKSDRVMTIKELYGFMI